MATKKSTKKAAKKPARRKKESGNTGRHSTQCTVCNHKDKEEIEARYLGFEPVVHVANEFGVSNYAIDRHAEFFGLDEQRASDTEKVLRNVIARGFAPHKTIDPKIAMAAVQELNRMHGKRQEDKPNENLTDEQRAQKAGSIVGKGKERMRLVKK